MFAKRALKIDVAFFPLRWNFSNSYTLHVHITVPYLQSYNLKFYLIPEHVNEFVNGRSPIFVFTFCLSLA